MNEKLRMEEIIGRAKKDCVNNFENIELNIGHACPEHPNIKPPEFIASLCFDVLLVLCQFQFLILACVPRTDEASKLATRRKEAVFLPQKKRYQLFRQKKMPIAWNSKNQKNQLLCLKPKNYGKKNSHG